MSLAATTRAEEVDRRAARRVILTCLCFFPLVAVINASSLLTEASRTGLTMDPRLPWVLEFTSMLAIALPVVLTIRLERRFPLVSADFPRSLIVLTAGSFAFSLLHVGGMAALRGLLVPLVTGKEYHLLADPVWDLLYEYRKDVFPYAVILSLLTLYRGLEKSRLEAETARTHPYATGRLTLKSGGRMIFLTASSTEWARAAGNYVELRAAGQIHLPRITLAALEQQLQGAGVDMVRVHRSHIVNRAMIKEVLPTGEGDLRIRLRDGSEIRGSRRYRSQMRV